MEIFNRQKKENKLPAEELEEGFQPMRYSQAKERGYNVLDYARKRAKAFFSDSIENTLVYPFFVAAGNTIYVLNTGQVPDGMTRGLIAAGSKELSDVVDGAVWPALKSGSFQGFFSEIGEYFSGKVKNPRATLLENVVEPLALGLIEGAYIEVVGEGNVDPSLYAAGTYVNSMLSALAVEGTELLGLPLLYMVAPGLRKGLKKLGEGTEKVIDFTFDASKESAESRPTYVRN